MAKPRPLPWVEGTLPLMLAPMQGVTHRAVRQVFAQWVRPHVLFTEFMRVRPSADSGQARLSDSDLDDAKAQEHGIPLLVQLIGRDRDPLLDAAITAQEAGAVHLNLNM